MLSLFLVFAGCKTVTIPPATTTNSITNIGEAANNIDIATDKNPIVTPHTNLIRKEIKNIGDSIAKTEKELSNTKTELIKERESYTQTQNKIIALITIISFILASISVALFVTGKIKTSIFTIVLGTVFFSMMALKIFLANQIIIGIIAAAIITISIIWAALKDRFNNHALIQTVASVDQAKKTGILNSAKFAKIANPIQTKKTKNIVSKIRDK